MRRFPWVEVIPYVVAQLAGARRRGGPHQRDLRVARERSQRVRRHGRRRWVHEGAGVVAEGLGTFLLLATIMALAVDRRAPAGFAGLVIGLAVACEIMVIGPISGGSVNPARTFGPYLATSIFGGSTPWSELWIYWVGPLVGGALAALAYDLIAQPERDRGGGARRRARRHVEASRAPRTGRAPEPTSTTEGDDPMAGNKAVAYIEPGKVEVQTIDYPKLEVQDGPGVHPANVGRKTPHGAILKIVATNICGSDQHMVRGRTTAPAGLILGHEITGEVIEAGPGVEFIKKGDLVSVPFNIACGRCRMCKEGNTGVCLNVNPGGYGSAYGYVDMGGWVGGQAEYVMVPYADWNLLKFPDKEQALEKILDLTMLSDIFPTGYHGCVSAGVTTGSTVYIAGAGPVGLAAAHAAQLLGAAVVIVGDMNERAPRSRPGASAARRST